MAVPILALVEFTDRPKPSSQSPLVVLGPSLGTSVTSLWSSAVRTLPGDYRVLGWDLPGHGASGPCREAFDMSELAQAVLGAVDRHQQAAGMSAGARFYYAGDSIGGCVGQQLLLDAPGQVCAAVLLATAARIGEPDAWVQRAQLVTAAGTSTQVEGSAQRWFAPGFLDREPTTGTALLNELRDIDRFSYAKACEALAVFDLRGRLEAVRAPVLAVAGAHDVATAPEVVEDLATATGGHMVLLPNVAHLIPAEAPRETARLMAGHFALARSITQEPKHEQ